jgi:hypothetical protein
MTTTLTVLAVIAALYLLFGCGLSESYWHMFGWYDTQAGAVTNNAMATITDPILTTSTTYFLMPSSAQLWAMYAFGADLTRARLNTPSLRYVGLPSVYPINIAANPPSPLNGWRLYNNPIPLPKVDTVTCESTTSAADTDAVMAIASFTSFRPSPGGKVYRVRGTAAITGVAGTWVNGAITMDQTLPQGVYSIVGMICYAPTCIGARLAFPGSGWRPGVIPINARSGNPDPCFTDGTVGEYGRFENANIPNLDICVAFGGSSATQEVFLDVIRLGDIGTVAPSTGTTPGAM